MSSKVSGIHDTGLGGLIVDVECQLSNGLPGIIVVGLATKAVDESKERLRSAFASSELQLPRKRIILNLAPADVPKDSTSFDLAMSVSILMAGGLTLPTDTSSVFIGELALDGSVRPVRGIIGKLLAARQLGLTTCFIPTANLKQAQLVPGLTLYPVATLKDLYLHLAKTLELPKRETGQGLYEAMPATKFDTDFGDVVGQERAKRALEIAAAGKHNVLMSGPPGTGKSMLAKALPSILPPLSRDEALEITHLHSLATRQYDQIMNTRPLRNPHHSASDTAIVGGGQKPKPGEISLAHGGVLFLDELPEFGRTTIEALRQPLEDKSITVARVYDSLTYPANFILVATRNPCPCGYYGSTKSCSCSLSELQRYEKKVSGPILDRIDLHITVDDVPHADLLSSLKLNGNETSERIAERVKQARHAQARRFSGGKLNGDATNRDIKRLMRLEPEAKSLLDKAADGLSLSARSYMRTIKVARTIADLDASDTITTKHISEALQYRPQLSLGLAQTA